MTKYLFSFLLFLSSLSGIEPGFYTSSGVFDDFSCNLYSQCNRCSLHAGYAFGQFISVESYGEIGLFLAPEAYYEIQPLIDLKGFIVDSHGAFSGGMGLRRWDSCYTSIWGANIFYDYRKVDYGGFYRVGIGLEWLIPECFNLRTNIYLPSNKLKPKKLRYYNLSHNRSPLEHPEDHHVIEYRHERSFWGVDFEVEKILWENCEYDLVLEGAIGGYVLTSEKVNRHKPKFDENHNFVGSHKSKDNNTIFGAQGRLELCCTPYLSLECLASWDKKFDAQIQGKIVLDLPLFDIMYGRCNDYWVVQITQPIKRHSIIFTTDKKEDKFFKTNYHHLGDKK